MKMKIQRIVITELEAGERLDTFLTRKEPTLTRSGIKNLIDKGNVAVNRRQIKAGYKLRVRDAVEYMIPDPEEVDLTPKDIPIEIVYQDEYLAVINKPQGLAVHPSAGHWDNTLVNALLYHIKDLSGINGELRPGIVYRLDKDTSGLMLVAKNDMAHRNLAEQIATKTCIRRYFALVQGIVKEENGHIETYIGRDPKNRKRMAVTNLTTDRKAISDYRVLERLDKYTLLEFQLSTGRTHQIRVHCAYMQHPIVGDVLYGYKHQDFKLNGQLLHSCYIEFTHPNSGKRLQFKSNLPDYFEEVLQKIRGS